MRIVLFGLLALLMAGLFAADLRADHGRRGRRSECSSGSCASANCSQPVSQSSQSTQDPLANGVVAPASPSTTTLPAPAAPASVTKSDDALAEVNATRAQRGLKPYVNDAVLNEAARKCAAYRASILCAGHCPGQRSDFAYLPTGYNTNGVVGGCAAWEPSWGWGACATYDNYTYCGAAWVMGSDGRRYMHLFAR